MKTEEMTVHSKTADGIQKCTKCRKTIKNRQSVFSIENSKTLEMEIIGYCTKCTEKFCRE